MPTTVTCHCGTKFESPEKSTDRRVNCPSCGSVIFLTSTPAPGSDDAELETYGLSDTRHAAADAPESTGVDGVPDWFERYRADREIKKADREKTIALLERLAAVNPTLDPLGAALYLAATHSDAETSVAALAKVAISGHPAYAPIAATLLAYVGPDDAGGAQQLIALLQETSEPQAALLLCQCLASMGPTSVVQVRSLIDLLAGRHAAIFLWGVQCLKMIGPAAKSAVPALIKTLQTGHHELRLATIEAFGAIARDPEHSLPVLLKVLQHQNAEYRAHAAEALGRFGISAAPAVPMLKTATQDHDPAVALAAVAALKIIEEAGPLPAAADPAAAAATAEPILVPCSCGKRLKVKAAYAGRKVKCPACGGTVAVPAAKAPTPAPAPAPASRTAAEKDCPSCLAAVPAAVVLCVHCGFDFRTGKSIAGTSS